MPRNQKDATFDIDTILHDTAPAAAAGAALVGTVAQILDLGPGRMDGRVIVDASAGLVGGGQLSTVVVQFSNTAIMNAGLMNGGAMQFGALAVCFQSADTAFPIHQELGVTNQINGVTYRYMRLWIVYAAAGSLTFTAWLKKAA